MCDARVLPKLLQKSDISLKEQLQIIQSVLQHCDAVHAHAESESGDFLRIVAVVLHELENIRIDHSAAKNLNPPGLLARTARDVVTIIAALSATAADEA